MKPFNIDTKTLTVRELVTWRLHWLAVELERHTGQKYSPETARSVLDISEHGIDRLRWELNTMFNWPEKLVDQLCELPEYVRIVTATATIRSECQSYNFALAQKSITEKLGVKQI
jgi:hypothetical protein